MNELRSRNRLSATAQSAHNVRRDLHWPSLRPALQ